MLPDVDGMSLSRTDLYKSVETVYPSEICDIAGHFNCVPKNRGCRTRVTHKFPPVALNSLLFYANYFSSQFTGYSSEERC